jgi:DNA invertase Pin-like site-specific DNA recombinase
LPDSKGLVAKKVFREKITGTTADWPQLQKLMKAVAPGDVVITPAVDRRSRDATDLLVIARDMQRAGVGLRSIAEPVVDTSSDFAELVLAMLGVTAKLVRRRILERIARGRADARARIEAGETQRSVARSYNSQATISRLTLDANCRPYHGASRPSMSTPQAEIGGMRPERQDAAPAQPALKVIGGLSWIAAEP